MADEIKRLNKMLNKKRLKGFLKPVENLEDSHFVLVEKIKDRFCNSNESIFKTEDYKALLESGKTYPPDIVHFLVITNKRNAQNIKNTLFALHNKGTKLS